MINEIAKKKKVKEMSAMEQLCYLFENNENDDILESDKRLVKAIMEKYKKMQDDHDLWSTAMAIEMGEMRVQNWIDDSFVMGKEAGIKEGIKEGKREGEHTVLEQLIQKRYKIDSSWLSTLNEQQISIVTDELLFCESFEELQKKVCR